MRSCFDLYIIGTGVYKKWERDTGSASRQRAYTGLGRLVALVCF